MQTIIKADRIICNPEEPVLKNHQVMINDDRIISVEKVASPPAVGSRLIELKGMTLLPGLIGCHVHTGFDASLSLEKTLMERVQSHLVELFNCRPHNQNISY